MSESTGKTPTLIASSTAVGNPSEYEADSRCIHYWIHAILNHEIAHKCFCHCGVISELE